MFDLDSAFAPWVLGEAAHTRLSAGAVGKRSLLEKLGFTRAQIADAGDVIIGRMTIEGAPHLKAEHYPVFDCANRCGKIGQRYLAPMSHVKMMAATQPFLSGAISKTVNLPNDATVEEVAKLYEEGWRLGLKAVALYRDGCKASQPLSSSGESKTEATEEAPKVAAAAKAIERLDPVPTTTAEHTPQLSLALTPKGTREYGMRIRLPKKRRGFTQEARVGGHKIFLRTGEYEDGRLGEIFIDMHKEGAAFRSLMNCFAMSVSVGLQYGVPLQTYVDQFTFTRFEPQGVVEGHPNVKLATSIVDYLFRVLGVEYLHRYDLAHVKPEESNPTLTAGDSRPVSGGQPADEQRPIPEFGYTKEATARSAAMSETLEGRGEPSVSIGNADADADAASKQAGGVLSAHLDAMMGDAPVCDVCGHITVRNGACYKCLNCGNSMGCS